MIVDLRSTTNQILALWAQRNSGFMPYKQIFKV